MTDLRSNNSPGKVEGVGLLRKGKSRVGEVRVEFFCSKCWISPSMRRQLFERATLVEETIESIRDVMAELRPAVLDDFGLAAGLRWYADKFTKRTGVPTAVIEQGLSRRLALAAEGAFFRIAQEALANTAKHAEARNAVVSLATMDESVRLVVEDDGRGFDPNTTRQPVREHGWGLMIMRERAAAVGAQLTVRSEPGSGTHVVVTLKIGTP